MSKTNVDDDVHISYEDQNKINKFAINNTKLHDIKDEIILKQKELQNLNDAIDELMLLNVDEDDETQTIPFMYGEVFAHLSMNEANSELEKAKKNLEDEIVGLESKLAGTKKLLDDLKVYLYGKFGNKINLEEPNEE